MSRTVLRRLENVSFMFPRRDKEKLIDVSLIQVLFFDLIDAAFMGVSDTISVHGIQPKSTEDQVTNTSDVAITVKSTFTEVMENTPKFNRRANLMGL